jgi:hypothetical protein
MRQAQVLLVTWLTLLGTPILSGAADTSPSYTKDIKPLLNRYCLVCHNNSKAKAGYSVETFDRLLRPGKKGAMVVPEKPDESRLVLTMTGGGKRMPPRKYAKQPDPAELATVRAWIQDSARDDTFVRGDDKRIRRAGTP